MSIREVLWRGSEGATRPLRATRRRTTRPRWNDPEWSDALRRLTESRPDLFIADAARIAGGELEFWGRTIQVDLQAVDWEADPNDGARVPAGSWRRWGRDPKSLWELHRQQHVFPLAAGAMLAEREDWARLAIQHLLEWATRNRPARGPGWSSGFETSHRLVGWTFALPLLRPAITAGELTRLDESFVRQWGFVAARPSRFSSANNHRIAEIVGLLAANRIAAGPEWERLWRELEQQVEQQTYRDGGSREQAAGYFLYVLELLWVAGVLAKSAGESLGRLEERLEAMLGWLEAVADDDGEPPPVGDDAEDRALRLEYFEPRRADAISDRVRALLGRSSSQRPARSRILRESGYAVFRAGRARILFDVGELGFGSLAAHGHADALAVLVDAGGQSVLRDSGTGTYAPAEVRDLFRATSAHNTVVVDGASQAQPLGPHLWGRRFRTTIEAAELSGDYDAVRASHDGYPGVRHARTVVFAKPDLLIVLDRILSDRPREATLVWQPCGDPALVVRSSPAARSSRGTGPWSPRYTAVREAPRLTWMARGRSVVFATALSLTGPPARMTLTEERGTTVVEVDQPTRLRILETWKGPVAEVEL
jgi:Heparinase II/III-like protein/Heparinase II/III N-terminus